MNEHITFYRTLSVGNTKLLLGTTTWMNTIPRIHENVVFPNNPEPVKVFDVLHHIDKRSVVIHLVGNYFKRAFDDASECLANLLVEGWQILEEGIDDNYQR